MTFPKSYLELIAACDNFSYDERHANTYYTLLLPHDIRPHGYIHPDVIAKMPWTSSFHINHQKRTVCLRDLSNGNDMSNICTAAFAAVVKSIISQNMFKVADAQYSEFYRILGSKYPIKIERYACPLFGIVHRGAHLTAYTYTATGEMKIWVPRRSPHLSSYPDMLDSTVAGGVQADESPYETIMREADEEASLYAPLLETRMHACGVLTYIHEISASFHGERGLVKPVTLYVYDINLSADVVPKPNDDEVKGFSLMSIEEVKDALTTEEFKINSAMVMVDFFLRHGIVNAENEKDYLEICTRMHRKLPFPVKPT